MTTYYVVTPRLTDYKNQKEVKEAFFLGKDFTYENVGPDMGRACSIRNFSKGDKIELRFRRKQNLAMVTV